MTGSAASNSSAQYVNLKAGNLDHGAFILHKYNLKDFFEILQASAGLIKVAPYSYGTVQTGVYIDQTRVEFSRLGKTLKTVSFFR